MSESVPAIADPSLEKRRELAARLKQRQSERTHRPTKLAPMSFAQQRLWFFDQLAPGTPMYNVPSGYRLRTPLDLAVLARTLNEIVRRHESLRTTFGTQNGVPMQMIHSELVLELPVEDLRAIPETEREREALRLATEEGQMPFNLRTGPLIRSKLLRLGEQDYLFLLTLHHIVSDGWSMGLLFRELNLIYPEFLMGRPSPFPDLQIQYADFAEWQKKSLQGELLEKQLTFWKSRLAGLTPLELPADRPRPAVTSFRGGELAIHLDEDLVGPLRRIGAEHGATLFMTLLAAFQLLLHRYTGQEDIAVGSPVANRNRAEIEVLIGFFVNSLVMRTSFAANPSFSQLLALVKDVAVEAYANQDLPFEMLVDELRPERDLSRNPLFEVMFQLVTVPEDQPREQNTAPSVRLQIGTAMFDLNLNLFETEGNGISGFIEYSTDLFDADRIARLSGHFQALLQSLAANPRQTIAEAVLLTPAERRRILTECNATQTAFPNQLAVPMFEAWAEKQPEAPAVLFASETLSYSALNRKANQLARWLLSEEMGVEAELAEAKVKIKRGDVVAICLERSPEFVAACLAVVKAGAAYLPLDPALPRERLAFVMADSQAAAVITSAEFANVFSAAGDGKRERIEVGAELIPLDLLRHQNDRLKINGKSSVRVVYVDRQAEEIARESAENLAVPLEAGDLADDLAYVIYTSGSTGQPKGTEIRHGSLANLVHWHAKHFEVTPRDRGGLLSGLGFDASVWELWSTLALGASLQIADNETRFSAGSLPQWIEAHGVTICLVPPPIFEMVIEGPWSADCRVRALVTGGDKLHRGVPKDLPFRVFNLYGPTEYCVIATYAEVPDRETEGIPPIGRPIANTEAFVVDSRGQLAPAGISGELWLSGAGLARGYRNGEAITKERFVAHPVTPGKLAYRTGDIVRYRSDGTLEFIGRNDRQVKIRGFRIELGEIEAAILSLPSVKSCAVTVRDDSRGEKRVAAYIVPSQTPFDLAALREALREKIPAYMVPAHLAVLDVLPLTVNGKVDFAALPPLADREQKGYAPPLSAMELKIAAIWQEELKIDRVGIDENFFDLGGNSLTLVRVHSRLKQDDPEANISVIDLFRHPTIRTLAEFLTSKSATGGGVSQAQEQGARLREALAARNASRRPHEPS